MFFIILERLRFVQERTYSAMTIRSHFIELLLIRGQDHQTDVVEKKIL